MLSKRSVGPTLRTVDYPTVRRVGLRTRKGERVSDKLDEEVQRVLDAIAMSGSEQEDPVERFKRLSALLAKWPELHKEVRSLRQDVANELYDGGMTYDAMGQLIGVTESRARHITKGIVNPSREKKKRESAAEQGAGDTEPT